MPALLFNGLLTAAYQPSQPILVPAQKVVLDFLLTIPAGPGVNVQWYLEFTDGLDPVSGQAVAMANWVWYRETAEEDISNGDVRMPIVVRRFSTNGADAVLPAGTHQLDGQFSRTHAFARIQIRGNGATAQVSAPFGKIPVG
jgi:hypothetical protein